MIQFFMSISKIVFGGKNLKNCVGLMTVSSTQIGSKTRDIFFCGSQSGRIPTSSSYLCEKLQLDERGPCEQTN